eukprot:CAMPEP_0174359034 /NCGR_PEP_ID=MMETSP0811_2-20130205/45975_1 /TAXON_ID=73025 ORGANISM="Eutreptiella gymnastica-like, Strain CCMP1594" /NCGR_SAMPLE_ID=MMETSP0811_2 /ASSEMBLY_ACC=CAM_ASM_000667 /LENGTH=49 /DNA_ID=CAMNT_0015493289 /DNA_START=97 /DNA_END=246 /DNA_ORIENTATION=-
MAVLDTEVPHGFEALSFAGILWRDEEWHVDGVPRRPRRRGDATPPRGKR